MANDFVLARCRLHETAEVLGMSAMLGIPPMHVVGCLVRVWGWARDEMDDQGRVKVAAAVIDGLAGVTGFADAMQSGGWLDTTTDSVSFPNHGRWISRDAVRKAHDRERKRKPPGSSAEEPRKKPGRSAEVPRKDCGLEREGEREGEREDDYVVVAGDVDLRALVSSRLARLAGISRTTVPGTLVAELVAYTDGQPARKHEAAHWPDDAPEPMDRARMLSAAFDVADAQAKSTSVYGIVGFVVTTMESAIAAGEYPEVRATPPPSWGKPEGMADKLGAVRAARKATA